MRPLLLLFLIAPLFAADYVELTLTDGRKLTGLYDGTTLDLFGNGTKIPVAAADIESKRAVERPVSNSSSQFVTVPASAPPAQSATAADPFAGASEEGRRANAADLAKREANRPSPDRMKTMLDAKAKADAAIAVAVREGIAFIKLSVKEGNGTASWETMCKHVIKLPSGKDSSAMFKAVAEVAKAMGKLNDPYALAWFLNGEPWGIEAAGRKAEAAAGIVR